MRGDLNHITKHNLTIALDEELLNIIKNISERNGLSVNAKVNEILKKYAFFYNHVEEQRGVTMARNYFAGVMDMLDEKKHVELFKKVAADEILPSISKHNNVPSTLDALIKNYFAKLIPWSGLYNRFSYNVDKDGNYHLACEHEFGVKHSRVLGESLCYYITKETGLRSKFEAFPTVISIEILADSSHYKK